MIYAQVPSGLNQETLQRLIAQLGAKRRRNNLRQVYYEGKNALIDFGISLPPSMRHMDSVLGWPAKAVSALASRVTFDGFVIPGAQQDPFELDSLLINSGLDATLPQAIQSSMIHSVAFLTITPGDTSKGEPPVVIMPKSALDATGLWDTRTQSLTDMLSVIERDETGMVTEMVWYARDHVTTLHRSSGGGWSADIRDNPLGRVWGEVLPFKPSLGRPFGHSRISRAVMSLTDAGLRTLARSEAHAEFFASPQRYALGADQEAFGSKADRWNAVMSRVLAISRDDAGEIPTVGQFPQMSMQPHFEHLKTIAALFAAETSLPLSSMGIIHDNPASAEAIYAAKEDAVIEAKSAHHAYGSGLRRAAITAVMMRDNLTEAPAELDALRAKWLNPATPSVVSASDAIVKQISAFPWMAESEVPLEVLGYDDATIARLVSDRQRAKGGSLLDRVLERRESEPEPAAAVVE